MESSAALGSLRQTFGSAINSESKVHSLCGNWSASGNSCVQRWRFKKNNEYTLVLRAKASKSSTTTKSDDSSDATVSNRKNTVRRTTFPKQVEFLDTIRILKNNDYTLVLRAKASKSDDSSDATVSNRKNTVRRTTFPKQVEALVHEMCDETEVAVLKLKVGDFEMNLKRKIGEATNPIPVADISPTVAPPIPSEPMNKSVSAAPSPSQTKPASAKVSPFMNDSYGKSSKLAALEKSGSTNYVLVTSPSVGKFQRSRTVKGKKQAPSCKEGDEIKEGQVIGYLLQLGTELPVTSDVAGEILKLLSDDGDSVGYGEPLVAVLPSFHDINIK